MLKKTKKAISILLACIMESSLVFMLLPPSEVPAASSVELLQEFDMEKVEITDQAAMGIY